MVFYNCSLEGLSPKTISKIGGLHKMLGLHDYGFVAVPRDSILCLPECDSSNKFGASFETPFGRHLVFLLLLVLIFVFYICLKIPHFFPKTVFHMFLR